MTYPIEYRRKALKLRERERLTIAEVAARFDVGIATIVRWNKELTPKPSGFRQRKIDAQALAQDVKDFPDAYQYERARRFGVRQNAIFCALKRIGVTYKKNTDSSQNRCRRSAQLPTSH